MTVRTIISSTEPPFTWVDVVDPTHDELADIARRYNLHPTSVEDSLEPEHLPKYERIGSTTFIIVRAIDADAKGDCSTLHELTRKVAIFYGNDFLITIHRTEQPFLTEIIEEYRDTAPPDGVQERRKGFLPRLLIYIVNGAIATYQKPLEDAEAAIDMFEATVFGEHEFAGLLRRIYLV
jgi:magnesium transporter